MEVSSKRVLTSAGGIFLSWRDADGGCGTCFSSRMISGEMTILAV